MPQNNKDISLLSPKIIGKFFDFIILTDDFKYKYKHPKVNYINYKDLKEFSGELNIPYSIFGVDRFTLDYSNIGSVEKKFNPKILMSVYRHVEQLIEDFCPDAIIPQVCDNSLSLISCLLAEKKNIFYYTEFVRPYMKNYQILISQEPSITFK